MGKIEIIFETLTPLFTGDINNKMTGIKPASIMGSLRFWFEVICHFSNKFNNEKYSKDKFDYNKYRKKLSERPNATDEEIYNYLQLTPSARYFGCTGLKSKIEIEKIKYDRNNFIRPRKKQIIDKKNWYLPEKYFEGQFTITFIISDNEIKNYILFPLLNFIQSYGFLGGKNNIGFGRVKFVDTENKIMNFKEFKIGNKFQIKFDALKLIKKVDTEDKLIDFGQIIYLKKNKYDKDYLKSIQDLLNQKSKLRKIEKNFRNRHYLFGYRKNEKYYKILNEKKYETDTGANATKIIPLIGENEIGFLAIPGIIFMKESENIK